MSEQIVLSWDQKPERKAWSKQLLGSVQANLTSLELGNPDGFIQGYSGLSADLKLKFWSELIVAMAFRESSWNPHSIYHEPPPLGIDSIGLLQLSYEDEGPYGLEPLSRQAHSLEDPLVNLRCGVTVLVKLLAHDHVVELTSGSTYKGAPRYWSVMRPGPKHHLEEIRTKVRTAVHL
ncbi:transglycosylase SLT domain-containing protein [Rugamonas rivuli]|uniref:Transglycosylase SLT domain-containing protein n=1 Tax=Rugamonas rivuli TaxID=2743358 RepID=A0A843SFF0_9BURK|nr:transglycosylase SLT domain-containing protein [Rugamonas rivuli]MQA20923.1 transglycosylase SLT domain-containing protein [Rugamonas rivuli]